MKVEDNDDESDSIRINYNILNTNDPPEIVSKSKSEPGYGPQYTNRDFINFSCVVDDPDLHIPDTEESLNVTWYTNISSKRTVLGYGDEVKLQEFKAGEYEIEILVTDNSGLQAYDFFDLKIEKSITLHKETDFTYLDNSTLDDVEYSYNADTKKFTITQGGFGEIDLVQLGAYYDENTDNIVIKLKFDGIIDTPVPYNVRVYLVKPHHIEPEQNYDVEFSADFYDRGLYTPPQGKYYGFFTNSDGEFKDDEFIIEYSLADLEEGVDGKFYPLESGFGLFAFVKWSEDEDLGRIKNYRYDSIGHVSAYAPPPGSVKNDDGSDSSDAGAINSSSMLIIIIIVILIVVLLIIFSVIKKKKGKSEKEVIDFSSATGPSRAPVPQQQIPQMFMSPFEQQFMGGPGAGAPSQPGQMPMPGPMMTPPPGSGGPGMQPGMQQQPQQRPQQTIPTPMPMQQQQMQRPQLPPGQGPQQQPKQRIPGTTPSTSPSPSTSTPGPGQMPVKGPTQKTPQQQQQPKPKQ